MKLPASARRDVMVSVAGDARHLRSVLAVRRPDAEECGALSASVRHAAGGRLPCAERGLAYHPQQAPVARHAGDVWSALARDNRFVPGSRRGTFRETFARRAGDVGEPETMMIGRPTRWTKHMAASQLKKGDPRRIGRAAGGLTPKRHAVGDGSGRSTIPLPAEGHASGRRGAAAMLDASPKARYLIGDRREMSGRYRATLIAGKIMARLPARRNRPDHQACDTVGYRQHRESKNMCGKPRGPTPHHNPLRPMCRHLHGRHHLRHPAHRLV